MTARVVELRDFGGSSTNDRFLSCAFNPQRRADLIAQGRLLGLILGPALVDPHAVLASSVRVGDGSFVNAGAVIGAMTLLGEGVLINRGVSIGHHCLLEDYVSVGPGATLAGNIRVGAGSTIGTGAVVLPDIRIGARAIVAGGSLVRRHVADGAFVAGAPATPRSFDARRSSLFLEDGE